MIWKRLAFDNYSNPICWYSWEDGRDPSFEFNKMVRRYYARFQLLLLCMTYFLVFHFVWIWWFQFENYFMMNQLFPIQHRRARSMSFSIWYFWFLWNSWNLYVKIHRVALRSRQRFYNKKDILMNLGISTFPKSRQCTDNFQFDAIIAVFWSGRACKSFKKHYYIGEGNWVLHRDRLFSNF